MLNLGDLTFGITANTAGLQAAQQQLQSFGRALQGTVTKAKGDIDATTSALIRQEGAALRALQQVQSMQNKIASGGLSPAAAQRLTSQLEAAFTKFSGAQAQRSPLNQLQQSRQAIAFSEQLQDVARSFGAESAAAKEAASASNAVQAAFEKQSLAAIRAEESVRVLQERLEQLQKTGGISPSTAAAMSGRLTGALGTLRESTLGAGADPLNAEAMLRSSQKFGSVLSSVRGELSQATRAAAPFSAAFRGISDALILSTGPFGMMAFRLRAATDLMKEFGVVAGGSVAALVGAGVAVFALGDAMLHADIALQQVEVTLKAVTGSSIVAQGEIAYLRDTANQAGLQFQAIAPNFARFEAAANATGQTLNVTHDEFTKMAMTMGTLHLNTQQTTNTIRTFDEIMSQGYVQTRNVVRQLATELPGAMDVAKKAAESLTGKIHITGSEMEKLMSGKQLPGPEFVKAFIDAYSKFAGVDLSKPIDTLQASLNRASNAWNYFLTTLSQSTGASQLFSQAIDGVTGLLDNLREHIGQVVSTIAGFVGAIAGIAASIAVWGAVGAAITFVTGAIRSMAIAAYFGAGAFDVLKIAMSPGIFIAIAQAILAVVSAFAGFKIAADAANNAMESLNAAMYKAESGPIQDYINAQKGLKDQVDTTTQAYIRQAEVIAGTLVVTATQQAVQQAKDQAYATDLQNQLNGKAVGSIEDKIFAQMNLTKAQDANNKSTQALLATQRQQMAMADQIAALYGIAGKPNRSLVGTGDLGAGTKKGPSPFAGTSEIEKIIEEAKTAQERVKDLLANPTGSSALLEDLAKAREMLYSISHSKDSAAQLAVVVGLMNAAGDSSIKVGAGLEEVTKHLEHFITSAREGKEMLKDWANTQERIKKGAADLASEQERITALVNGLNPNAQDLFKKPLDDARKIIAEFSKFPELMAVLQEATKGAAGADLEHRLATLLGGGEALKQAEEPLKNINEQFLTMTGNLASLKASSVGTILDQGYLEQARKALENLDANGLALVEQSLSRFMTVTGDATTDLAGFLKMQTLVQQATDLHKQALENNIKAWQSWADGVVDTIGKVLQGGESLGTGIKDIFGSLAKTIVNAALIDPMKLALNQGISNMMQGITSGFGATSMGGLWGTIGNVIKSAFGGGAQGFSGAAGTSAALAATTSLTAATTATAASTTAQGIATATATASLVAFTGALDLASVAAMGSATSGITSFLSPLIGVGTLMSVATGTQGPISGPGTTTSDSILARVSKGEWIINAAVGQRYGSLLRAITTGKALPGFAYGGVAGNAAGDLFVPGVGSQAMSAAITNANSTGIDARAYIDARGATPDAVAALRDEMRIREAKLKSQLPQIIDARTVDNRVRNRWGMAY